MEILTKSQTAILGAFIGDATALGLHWLYEPARILEIAPQHPEFVSPDPMDYEGVAGYFAHHGCEAGEWTHYGAHLWTALDSIKESSNTWSPEKFQKFFQETFDRGGSFSGYIDGATNKTLDFLSNLATGQKKLKSGADDNQISAFAKIPAVVGAINNSPRFEKSIETAVRLTNNNDEAVTYSLYAAHVLHQVINGAEVKNALLLALELVEDKFDLHAKINQALSYESLDPQSLAKDFGMPCPLSATIPLSVAILNQTENFIDATRINIYSGGDNAGRGLFIGSVLGAAHGIETTNGIPLHWLTRHHYLPEIMDAI